MTFHSAGVLDTVGDSPSFPLIHSTDSRSARIVAKWERTNPAGSVKDRPALHLVDFAERTGLLQPGGTIIESSSGNFGISLAMIGAARKYRVIILVDPKATPANLRVLHAYGAEVVVVTEQDDTGSYHKTRIARANELAAAIPNSFRPDQCFNLANSEAHYQATGPEIVAEVGYPDVVVAAVSTGGQLGGLSRYFRDRSPKTVLVGVDAEGSQIFGGQSAAYAVPGVGLGWTPVNLDLALVDDAFKISSELVFQACRALARHEGILAGASSGAVYLAALRYARTLRPGQTVVAMLSDSGDRYLDTVFDPAWLEERGLSARTPDLEQLCAYADGLRSAAPLRPALVPGLEEELGIPATTLWMNAEVSGSRVG